MSILQEPIQNAIARLRKQHNDDGDYEAKSCQRSLSKDVWESISAFEIHMVALCSLVWMNTMDSLAFRIFTSTECGTNLSKVWEMAVGMESDSQILQNMMFHVKPLTAVRFSLFVYMKTI